jgi:hypothetical protein
LCRLIHLEAELLLELVERLERRLHQPQRGIAVFPLRDETVERVRRLIAEAGKFFLRQLADVRQAFEHIAEAIDRRDRRSADRVTRDGHFPLDQIEGRATRESRLVELRLQVRDDRPDLLQDLREGCALLLQRGNPGAERARSAPSCGALTRDRGIGGER